MAYKQPATPTMKPAEYGRPFAPAYSTPLAEDVILTALWEHVCSARFGEGRPTGWSGKTLWTGDSYRYDIFRQGEKIALRWWNGAGEGWLIAEDKSRRGESSLLLTIAANPSEEARWDACHFLWEVATKTAGAAKLAEFKRVADAYVDGRLKKRKVRGQNSFDVKIVASGLTS